MVKWNDVMIADGDDAKEVMHAQRLMDEGKTDQLIDMISEDPGIVNSEEENVFVANLIFKMISNDKAYEILKNNLVERCRVTEDLEKTVKIVLSSKVGPDYRERQLELWMELAVAMQHKFNSKVMMTVSQLCALSCLSCNTLLITEIFGRFPSIKQKSIHFWEDDAHETKTNIFSVLSYILSIPDLEDMQKVTNLVFNETNYNPFVREPALLGHERPSAVEYELKENRYKIPQFVWNAIKRKKVEIDLTKTPKGYSS